MALSTEEIKALNDPNQKRVNLILHEIKPFEKKVKIFDQFVSVEFHAQISVNGINVGSILKFKNPSDMSKPFGFMARTQDDYGTFTIESHPPFRFSSVQKAAESLTDWHAKVGTFGKSKF